MSPRSRAYARLLRLLPPEVRRVRGPEMERLAEDMRREWEKERGGAGVGFWLALTWDTAKEAAAAWLSLVAGAAPHARTTPEESAMAAWIADTRFALRQLVRRPMFGGLILLLMAVGIAGNAAVFRIFNGLFLRPLPFEAAGRLVDLDERAPEWDLEYTGVSYFDFTAWRRDNRSFASMAAFTLGGSNLTADGSAVRVDVLASTHDLDDVLMLEPTLGRFYSAEEDVPDGPGVVLLTDGLWAERFARDPGVLGRTVSLDGEPHEVIGILPPAARFVAAADLWLPLRENPLESTGWYLQGVGRLRDGATLEEAAADLRRVHESLIPERDVNSVTSPVVSRLADRYLGRYRLGSGFLLAAVAVVLLIACANIAGLMFARSLSRAAELGIREALGASRGRIARQLLAESLLIAGLGGTVGTLAGLWGSAALVRATANRLPSWVTFDLDVRVVLFLAALTAGASLVSGMAPALRAPRADLSGQGRATSSRTRRRWMSVLVAGEVALAVALLVVGGLAVLDVWRLGRIDPGFRTEGVLTYRIQLPDGRYPDAAARMDFTERYLARLRALPGVQGAAAANRLPLSGHLGWSFTVENAAEHAAGESNPVVLLRSVTSGYFETLGVQLLAGRTFDDFDHRPESSGVVIVNETFVRTHLGGAPDPLGRRVAMGATPTDEDEWLTVVGVTRDVMHYGPEREMRPGVYVPYRRLSMGAGAPMVAIRTGGDLETLAAATRATTAELDPEVPPHDVMTLGDRLRESLWTRRATAWLIGSFSAVALLLAVAGLYGVISYAVGQRAQEIGIRMAMGARAEQVRAQVLRQGMTIAGSGLTVGLLGALAGGRVVGGILVGVRPTEPAVYVTVGLLLAVVTALANWLPARRAASLDPMRALRGE